MSNSTDLSNLYTALRLEIAAVARYQDHESRSANPTVFALLEGLMRNEQGHEDELRKNIVRLGGDTKTAEELPAPSLPSMVYDGDQVTGEKTTLAMLRADLAFENEATMTYHKFFAVAEDEEAKELFKELARAEKGHVNGLKKLIQAVETGDHTVKFFCPVCGWDVDFGTTPEAGSESRCPMCGVLWALEEQDGDFAVVRK